MPPEQPAGDAPTAAPARSEGGGRLVLFGQAPVAVLLEVDRRSDRERAKRAVLRLAACWLAIPIVVFIPPHIPWVAIAVIAGPYLARREWVGEYVVRRFEGRCPGCGGGLDLAAGKAIRLPMAIDCPHCHRQATLERTEARRA
jgi:hypothetical protein